MVKNLRKDRQCYWVYSHITPIFGEGEAAECTAARQPVTPSEIEEAEKIYEKLLREKN